MRVRGLVTMAMMAVGLAACAADRSAVQTVERDAHGRAIVR